MKKYTCGECNGRAGTILPFAYPDDYPYEPFYCPSCGSGRHLVELDTYLEKYANGEGERYTLD